MHLKLCSIVVLALVHISPGEPTPKLKLMGSIGETSFFYDNELRTWLESVLYCESLGMNLADLPTLSHIQLVKDYSETDSEFSAVRGHWTSGLHRMKITQFVWWNTEAQVSADLPFLLIPGPITCLSLDEGDLIGMPCENNYGVLCQTKQPNFINKL